MCLSHQLILGLSARVEIESREVLLRWLWQNPILGWTCMRANGVDSMGFAAGDRIFWLCEEEGEGMVSVPTFLPLHLVSVLFQSARHGALS